MNNTNWTIYTASFTAPAAYDHVLKVIITHDNPAGEYINLRSEFYCPFVVYYYPIFTNPIH